MQSKGIIIDTNIEEGFQRIKEAGFQCIDFSLDQYMVNSDIYAGKNLHFFDKSEDEIRDYFSKHHDYAKKYGLYYSQMHMPYPLYVYGKEEISQYMWEQVVPKSLLVCETLECPYIVVHPFKIRTQLGIEAEKEENIRYFKKLIPMLRGKTYKICFENLYENRNGRLVPGVCAYPEEAIYYLDTLNEMAGEECFGFCFDVGHANLIGMDMYRMITMLGNRLKVLHLHDNDGIYDLHQIPYTFTRERGKALATDWEGVLQGLRDIGFGGTLSFETYPGMSCFPERIQQKVLELIAEIGKEMQQRILIFPTPDSEVTLY